MSNIREIAYRVGQSYARDGWSNADAAAAAWLNSGNSSSVECQPDRLTAEMGFVSGFRAARAASVRRVRS